MNKSLYHAAKPIFDAACELNGSERSDYLSHACGANTELRALVEELLQAEAQEPPDNRALHRALERSIAPNDERAGSAIDRFQLRDRIGEGGFGTVWRATQQEPVQRDVALKVLKPGMDSAKIVARFEAERQALALMDHPSIAQVYDGGVTGAGRPYFAMELVDGWPIADYCRERELTLRQRLDLFVKVCNAIQHAHQKGIIHRDIKPSNVLVAQLEGAAFPKVIDFGIAKAMSLDADTQPQLTEQHQIIGTPEYMAPEQLDNRSRGIDTRADVYALGVLLYELLTGSRPFENESTSDGSVHSLLEAIRHSEPQKPSTRAATRQGRTTATGTRIRIHAALRGDLDWIVLRALDKDRNRRYGSVGALADDIGRHLRQEPVSAGPPSRIYRLRKFVARNRSSVLASALVMLSLVAGLIASSMSLGWALEERERADQRFDLALRAVRDYHSGIAEDAFLSQQHMAALRTRLLEPPRDLYEKLEQTLSDDARPEEREALCDALQGLAALLDDVGEGQQAIATYQRAATLLRQLESDAEDPAPVRFQRATLLGLVGRLQALEGQTDEAIATLRNAIATTREALQATPDNPRFRNHLADATAELGSVFRQLGDFEQAHAHWRDALAIYQQLRKTKSERSDVSKDIADIYNSMGRVALNSSRTEDARQHFSKALAIAEENLVPHPKTTGLMNRVATCAGNLGNACSQLGDHEAAHAAYARAIELGDELLRNFPGVSDYRHSLGNTCSAMASTLAELERHDEARRHYERGLTLLNTAVSVADLRLLAQAFSSMAGFLMDRNEGEDAIEHFRNAVAVYDRLLELSPDPDIRSAAANCFNNYGSIANRHGQPQEAKTLYERSIALREQVLEAYPNHLGQHLNMSAALRNLGRLHFDAKRYGAAIPLYTRSIAITERLAEQYESKPDNQRWWRLHRGGYWDRANAHQMSDQYQLAVDDWLRASVIDNGKMRARYLTQLFGDMVRGNLLTDIDAQVQQFAKRTGATLPDLSKVGAAYLKGPGNESYLPISIAIADHAIPRIQREQPEQAWRFFEIRARAQLQLDELEAASASVARARAQLPANANVAVRDQLVLLQKAIDAARQR